MFGNNPIRPPLIGDGTKLLIQEIFPTIQGEGIYVGVPAIFVRLGGCNLACKFCDTEFESFTEMDNDVIISKIIALAKNNIKLVVITGGEPLRQPIELLCNELLELSFQVQIETNGTLFLELPEEVTIICSPKNSGKGYFPIREDLLEKITALKFLISKHKKTYNKIPEIGQTKHNIPIYIQPMDEYDEHKNKENLALAIETCIKNNYRLSIQLHKIIGVR
jgi:7-carboxy-7-deazaguanine synthase